jgi:cytidylate kinase
MPVIAIASELAGDGEEIARKIASRLGLSFLDHSKVLERLATHGFLLSELVQIQNHGHATPEKSWQLKKIGKIISSEILFLAQKNSMMLHSPYAPYLLTGISHIPRIQVRTPSLQRAKNYAVAHACDDAQALEQIRHHDLREAYILDTYFGVDSPGHTDYFDLVADTGWLSATDWVEQILDLVRDPDFEATANSRAKLHALAAAATCSKSSNACANNASIVGASC